MTPMEGGNRNLDQAQKKWLRSLCRSRAAIEPTIGHLKSDYGLDRNFLSGIEGDVVNTLLAGAAWNLKMRLRELKAAILGLLGAILRSVTAVVAIYINRSRGMMSYQAA
jgi:IS5 family transposase